MRIQNDSLVKMAACVQPMLADNGIGLNKQLQLSPEVVVVVTPRSRLTNEISHARTASINRRVVKGRRSSRTDKQADRRSNANVQLVSGSQMDQCLLSTVGNWNFNVFNLDKLTNGRSLFHISLHIFQEHNLIQHFNLDILKLMRCISLIENSYHDSNPYHNAMHAADVAQAMHCFLSEPKLLKHLTPLEKLVAILGAITHDVDHPGVNQAYLIATTNPLASLYNKVSVLENHHWRVAVGFLSESGVFSHLETSTWKSIVWQIKSLILATDITRQKEFLSKLKSHNEQGTLDLTVTENRHFILQIALKCADICNPCRPWEISKRWSNAVCEEFFMQGEQESRLGLPVTPLCDRHCTTVAKIQTGFMQFVVRPLFEQWNKFCKTAKSQVLLTHVDCNKKMWDEEIAADAALASDESSGTSSSCEEMEEEDISITSLPTTVIADSSENTLKEPDISTLDTDRLSPLNEEQSDDSAGNAKMIYASDSSYVTDSDDDDDVRPQPPSVQRPLNFARRHSMPTQIVARHCPRRSNSTTSRRHSLPHEDLDQSSASRFDLLCDKLSAVLESMSTATGGTTLISSGSDSFMSGETTTSATTALSGTLVSLSTCTDCLEIANFQLESDIQMDAHGLTRTTASKSKSSRHASSDPFINKASRGRQLTSVVEQSGQQQRRRNSNASAKIRFSDMSHSFTG